MENTKEHTTISIKKELRDGLAILKFKYKMYDLNQVIQLLYDIRNESIFKKQKLNSQIKSK